MTLYKLTEKDGGPVQMMTASVPFRAKKQPKCYYLPPCRRIEPDADNNGYYCRTCGGELVERGDWYRHGTAWRHPEVLDRP